MKITVSESKWGPKYLLNPDNGKMCVIGQAGEQCGADLSKMRGRTMMSVDELGLDQRMCNQEASNDTQRAIGELAGCNLAPFTADKTGGGKQVTQIKSYIGYMNDAYHRATDKGLRKQLKVAIVAAFAEAGYELEFVK